jgi:DNA-binding CsgD family transcriptional regulator
MLPDVDRISIDVNTSVDLDTPEDYEPDLFLMQTVLPNGAPPAVRLEAAGTPGAMAAHLVEGFRAGGVSLDIYHPPLWREYYLADNAYLGTIFLWRERVRRPLTEETVATLDSLHRFMLFILSDIVARHHYANPLDRVFYDVVRSLSDECGLGRQERRVLVRRLLGESFKTIADQMSIAPNTVGQYVSAIYRKTGTRSAVELFAKYFTPRLTSIDVSLISNR